MINFANIGSTLFEVLIKVEVHKDGKFDYKQLFPENNVNFDKSVLKFCFPKKDQKGHEKFVFAIKSGDDSYQYGYVIQKNQTAFCVLSSFYDELKIMRLLDSFMVKLDAGDRNGAKKILEINLKPNIYGDSLLSEQIMITSLVKDMFKLVDPYIVGILIAYIALDERVIVTSSQLEKISHFCFSLISLIFPLQRPGVFIPILPFFLIDTLLAPFPFIIGIHNSLMQDVKTSDLESHVMLNIDGKRLSNMKSIELPKQVYHLIEKFTKDVNSSSPLETSKLCRNLFLSIIGYGLGTSCDKPFKMFREWNALKDDVPEEGDFGGAIVASQTVLKLMRAVEEVEEGGYNEIFTNFWPNIKVSIPTLAKERYDRRAKTTIINLPDVTLNNTELDEPKPRETYNQKKRVDTLPSPKATQEIKHDIKLNKVSITKEEKEEVKVIDPDKMTFKERVQFYKNLEKS